MIMIIGSRTHSHISSVVMRCVCSNHSITRIMRMVIVVSLLVVVLLLVVVSVAPPLVIDVLSIAVSVVVS